MTAGEKTKIDFKNSPEDREKLAGFIEQMEAVVGDHGDIEMIFAHTKPNERLEANLPEAMKVVTMLALRDVAMAGNVGQPRQAVIKKSIEKNIYIDQSIDSMIITYDGLSALANATELDFYSGKYESAVQAINNRILNALGANKFKQ